MSTACFHNITDKVFTAYWDGKAYRFKPGERRYMQIELAEHFAKYLTNQILIERGQVTATSPKKPKEQPLFMEIFNQACIPEQDTEDLDENQVQMDIDNRKQGKPAADRPVKEKPAKNNVGPGKGPQVIGTIINDEDEDDENSAFAGLDDKKPVNDPEKTDEKKEDDKKPEKK